MIEFVIDANILMSILISGRASYKPILAFHNFILPELVLVEIEKYKGVLSNKTRMSENEFIEWSYFVFSEITILPNYVLKQEVLEKTEILLSDIDTKDIAYVALAMQLDLPLLTRDKPLYKGIRKKGFRKVILFDDFLENL